MDINIELPEDLDKGIIFTHDDTTNKIHFGIPNKEVFDHMKSWIDLIKKQNESQDEWHELPWFPDLKFKNLKMMNELSGDNNQVIHFVYDDIINKQTQ